MDIYGYWADTLRQDAASMRGYFHPDACIRWHNTNELFTVDEFIRANCEYPSQWEGSVERTETTGDLLITAVHVYTRDRTLSFHVVSFIRLREDKIVSIDEYWGDDGAVPQWRQDMHIGSPIK